MHSCSALKTLGVYRVSPTYLPTKLLDPGLRNAFIGGICFDLQDSISFTPLDPLDMIGSSQTSHIFLKVNILPPSASSYHHPQLLTIKANIKTTRKKTHLSSLIVSPPPSPRHVLPILPARPSPTHTLSLAHCPLMPRHRPLRASDPPEDLV